MMASKNEKQISASSIQDPYESTTLNCTSLSEVVMEIDGTQLKLKYTQQRRVTEENGVFSNTSDVKRVRSIKGKIWKQEGTSSSYKEVTQTSTVPDGEDWNSGMVQEGAWTTETNLSPSELAEFEEIWMKMWRPKLAAFTTVSILDY